MATKTKVSRSKTQRKATKSPSKKPAAATKPGPSEWTQEDGALFSKWFAERKELERSELKLTRWSDSTCPRYGIKSTGDMFMAMMGCGYGDPEESMHFMTVFNAIACELDMMADSEMGKREARQKSDLHSTYQSDLYAPLHYLAQRCRAMGEMIPRIMKANFVTTSDGQPITFRTAGKP